MEKAKLERINEYARRVRNGETLSDSELADRAALRTEYLAEIRQSFGGILDSAVIVRPDGATEKVSERKKQDR